MAGFVIGAQHGQLNISGIALNGPAWKIQNFAELRSLAIRGESLLIPRATGRKSRRRWIDENVIGIEMIVRGDCDSSGNAVSGLASQLTQLHTNLNTLEAIALPPTDEVGRSAALTLPGGSPKAASVWVQSWQVAPAADTALARVAFDLVIPAGRFT
jgi:hypothetical protein